MAAPGLKVAVVWPKQTFYLVNLAPPLVAADASPVGRRRLHVRDFDKVHG
jgi:hypothetical protein